MKGIVFTEFLEMVEDVFSYEVADQIIERSSTATDGAYTALGNYDHQEMLKMVTHLSEITETPAPILVKAFGKHLFSRFVQGYPKFFETSQSAFEFLGGIESYIHVEVRKLYSDSELPSFSYTTQTPTELRMVYQSKRPFGDLAEGLIQGCLAHYQETATIQRVDAFDGVYYRSEFHLTK